MAAQYGVNAADIAAAMLAADADDYARRAEKAEAQVAAVTDLAQILLRSDRTDSNRFVGMAICGALGIPVPTKESN